MKNPNFQFTLQMRQELLRKRLALGLTYCSLGRFLGVSWSTVRKWELGASLTCHARHSKMIKDFLGGVYDKSFQGQMDTSNISAYLHTASPEIIACIQRMTNCYRLLATRLDLRQRLLGTTMAAVTDTVSQLLLESRGRRARA